MKKPHILCIAPYEGMYEIFCSVTALRNDVTCTVLRGDLEEGVQVAAKYMTDDIDAIISRGETANLLEKAFTVPVFHINFSSYDILRSIKAAQNISDKFVIIGSADIAKNARLLCDLLQYSNVRIETIGNIKETQVILQGAKNQGYFLVIGDKNTVNYAQRANMQHILIMSGLESIEEALDRAVYVTNNINDYMEQLSVLQRAMLHFPCDFVVMDDSEKIYYSTLSTDFAEGFLPLIKELIPGLYRSESIDLSKMYNGSHYMIEGSLFPVRTQRFALFQISHRPDLISCNSIRFYNKGEFDPPLYSLPWGHGKRITELVSTADQYGHLACPMLIAGEYGSEIDQLAVHIYQANSGFNAPLVSVNCTTISAREWTNLFENYNSPLFSKTSVLYFQNLESLSDEQLNILFTFLEDSGICLRSKVLMSFQQSSRKEFDCFYKHYLARLVSIVVLQVPPLREHPEDIWEISNLYINELSLKHGKQVIGLQPDAAEQLRTFSWPQNIAQLKQVLTAAVIATDTSYISSKDLNFIMNSTIPPKELAGNADCINIDFALTLREIEQEIVRHVLRLEGMNQSRTAKRLNISRSTLWRLLNE